MKIEVYSNALVVDATVVRIVQHSEPEVHRAENGQMVVGVELEADSLTMHRAPYDFSGAQ